VCARQIVFTEIIETPAPESRREKKTLDIERTLDFSIFDLPKLGSGNSAPVFIIDDDYTCFGMPTIWPQDRPHTPDYDLEEEPEREIEPEIEVQFLLKRRHHHYMSDTSESSDIISSFTEAGTSMSVGRSRLRSSNFVGHTDYQGFRYEHHKYQDSGIVTRSATSKTGAKYAKKTRTLKGARQRQEIEISVLSRDVLNTLSTSPPFYYQSGDFVAITSDPNVDGSRFMTAARGALRQYRQFDTG
jgi:hypothetical protein